MLLLLLGLLQDLKAIHLASSTGQGNDMFKCTSGSPMRGTNARN